MVGWTEVSKEIIKVLRIRHHYYVNFIKTRKATPIEKIKNWNMYNKPLRNSNSIEVQNKHHREAAGHYPIIDDFNKYFLTKFDTTISEFNHDQNRKVLRDSAKNVHTKEKETILSKYLQISSFREYKVFSAELTILKYKANNHSIKDYFSSSTNEHTDNNYLSIYNFNSDIGVDNPQTINGRSTKNSITIIHREI